MTKDKKMAILIDALSICHELAADLFKKPGRTDDKAGKVAAFAIASIILEWQGLLRDYSYIKPFLQVSEAVQRDEREGRPNHNHQA